MNNTINPADYTARDLNSLLRKMFGNFKNGRSRKVYIDKTNRIVYKLPVLSNAGKFNEQEYKNYIAYKMGLSNVVLAQCELHYTIDKVPIIIMELVDTRAIVYTWDMPEWAKHGKVDSYQIGTNDAGDIVAYDYTAGV